MAASLYDMSVTDASNTAFNGISQAENVMKPSDVNNDFRAHDGAIARYIADEWAVNTATGTDTYALTAAQGITAYATGIGLRFIAPNANTGAATLNINGIGAKAIRKISAGTDVALAAGDLAAGETYTVVYRASANSAAGAWVLVSPAVSLAAVVKTVKSQVFTASGTYTPSAGMLYCRIECVGSGGGSGGLVGLAGGVMSGGGGGSGGYSVHIATAAAIGASQTVTVGAAGTAGASGANNGVDGADVSVGSLCIAKGGSKGLFGQSGVQSGSGGAGGVAGTGNVLTAPGQPGQTGPTATIATVNMLGADGGSSIYGPGGRGVSGIGTGAAGSLYGGGGAGPIQTNGGNLAGSAGGKGIVIITEFCNA